MLSEGSQDTNKEIENAIPTERLVRPEPDEAFLHTLLKKGNNERSYWKKAIEGIAASGVIRSNALRPTGDSIIPSRNYDLDYQLQTSLISPRKKAIFGINDITLLFTGEDLASINALTVRKDGYPGIVTRYDSNGAYYGTEIPVGSSYIIVNSAIQSEELGNLLALLQTSKGISADWISQHLYLFNGDPQTVIDHLDQNGKLEVKANEWSNQTIQGQADNMFGNLPPLSPEITSTAVSENNLIANKPTINEFHIPGSYALKDFRQKVELLLKYGVIKNEDYEKILAMGQKADEIQESYQKLLGAKRYFYDRQRNLLIYTQNADFAYGASIKIIPCDKEPEVESKDYGLDKYDKVKIESSGKVQDLKFDYSEI